MEATHRGLADTHSKYEDNSQWELNPGVYEQILAQPELAGRCPACDLLADEHRTKVPGAFYSRYRNPTALGIDGFAQLGNHRRAGRPHCCMPTCHLTMSAEAA